MEAVIILRDVTTYLLPVPLKDGVSGMPSFRSAGRGMTGNRGVIGASYHRFPDVTVGINVSD